MTRPVCKSKLQKKFLITDGSDLLPKNIIRANKDLELALGGEPKKVTELRQGTLLIETKSKQQSIRIQEVQRLQVQRDLEPKTLNSSKGTIVYSN